MEHSSKKIVLDLFHLFRSSPRLAKKCSVGTSLEHFFLQERSVRLQRLARLSRTLNRWNTFYEVKYG
jgi:hypothetical protein